MTLANIINQYARPYSPYASGLVNHLPMGQLALYMMGSDSEKVRHYSENYVKGDKIDKVREAYTRVKSIEECLGQRDLYEGCLEFITKEILSMGPDPLIKKVLNDYPLGMSSGLFHTSIRLAYGVQGAAQDPELTEEVSRALAYYITAYRPGKEFKRKTPAKQFSKEIQILLEDSHISKIISSQPTRGKQMKALYEDEIYLNEAPLIDGSTKDKVTGLLGLLLPFLDKTNNIVVLHCVTGLQALLVLEQYFDDFNHALDIMTACIITHLLTVEDISTENAQELSTQSSWEAITQKATTSPDVHTIKFVYTAHQLYEIYKLPALKQSAYKRAYK